MFIRIILSIMLFLIALTATGQQNTRYEQYIEQYKDLAIKQMLKWNVPASITLAQGLLESAAGKSTLASKGNNHFGIKCHNTWTGDVMYLDDDAKDECFRVYESVFDSYEDHSRFLAKGQRYKSLFSLEITDYKGWAKGLKAAGYATSPTYAQSLIDIIERYDLAQYDREESYDRFMVNRVRGETLLHNILKLNNNYYLIAQEGDTYRTIAQEVGISYKKLARYNERGRDDVLKEGEPVWLKKKRTKGQSDWKGRTHIVKEGDSMYTVAQLYGIRVKSLYKLNNLPSDYTIQPGDKIKLR